jgi:hypothetical protein
MRSKPNDSNGSAVANFVRRLLQGRSGDRGARAAPGAGMHDDLAALRCLRETFPDRLADCDCAEFLRPDGRLIWEQGSVRDAP